MERAKAKNFSRQSNLLEMPRIHAGVLVLVNFTGVCMELLKNLLLTGFERILLCDAAEEKVTVFDVGAGYLLQASDVGKSRITPAIIARFDYLNRYKHPIEVVGKHALCAALSGLEPHAVVIFDAVDAKFVKEIDSECQRLSIPLCCVDIMSTTIQYCCGNVSEFKTNFKVDFKKVSLLTPFMKGKTNEKGNLYHAAIETARLFREKEGRLPLPDEKDFKLFKSMLPLSNEIVKKNEDRLRFFASTCRGLLPPLVNFTCGIVTCEIIKIVCGKKSGVKFFVSDFSHLLPLPKIPNHEDLQLCNDRYDAQRAVIGKKLQSQLEKLRIFVVGAGGTGCEQMKLLALVGCKSIRVTDYDKVEASNLCRTCLFSFEDVDKESEKSTVARDMLKKVNPKIELVKAYPHRVQNTKSFNKKFFQEIDLVFSCVDTVKVRQFISDKISKQFQLPFFDSGVGGYSGQSFVFIPNITPAFTMEWDPISEKDDELRTLFCTRHIVPKDDNDIDPYIFKGLGSFNRIFQRDVSRVKIGDKSPFRFQCSSFNDCVCLAKILFEDDIMSKYDQVIDIVQNEANLLIEYYWVAANLINQVHGGLFAVPVGDHKEIIAECEGKMLSEESNKNELKGFFFDKDCPMHVEYIRIVSKIMIRVYGKLNESIERCELLLTDAKIMKVAGNMQDQLLYPIVTISGLLMLNIYWFAKGKHGDYRDFRLNMGIGHGIGTVSYDCSIEHGRDVKKEWEYIPIDLRTHGEISILDLEKKFKESVFSILVVSNGIRYQVFRAKKNGDEKEKEVLLSSIMPKGLNVDIVILYIGLQTIENEFIVKLVEYRLPIKELGKRVSIDNAMTESVSFAEEEGGFMEI